MVLIVVARFVARVETRSSANTSALLPRLALLALLALLILLMAGHRILDWRHRAVTALVIAAERHGES